MNILAACVAAALAILLGWRGGRRGAIATVLHCVPFLAGICVLLLALCAAWTWPAHFVTIACAGGMVAIAAALGLTLLMRRRRRRGLPSLRLTARMALLDRTLGVLLGVLHACLLCMALALVGSILIYVLNRRPAFGVPSPPSQHWMSAVGQTCRILDHASFRLLDRLPGLNEYSGEIHALVVILNAPPERLTRLARDRGLDRLSNIPEVRAAVADDQFMGLVERLRRGDLSALPLLAGSPVAQQLLACPELRALARSLKPSDLARELEADKPLHAEPDGT